MTTLFQNIYIIILYVTPDVEPALGHNVIFCAKPKGSNCLLVKQLLPFWLCTEVQWFTICWGLHSTVPSGKKLMLIIYIYSTYQCFALIKSNMQTPKQTWWTQCWFNVESILKQQWINVSCYSWDTWLYIWYIIEYFLCGEGGGG